MSENFYKGYYMITNKCNLACTYCVLENSKEQLALELNLEGKKKLIHHLYRKLNFRSLTLTGGEALVIGEKKNNDFMELLDYLKQFKSTDPNTNLNLHLYTNGIKLTPEIADKMVGVIDEVSINIDSANNTILKKLGRSKKYNYFNTFIQVCTLLSSRKIKIKLHTVLCSVNKDEIINDFSIILDALQDNNINVSNWKLYQYMSYDVPEIDKEHKITRNSFEFIKDAISKKVSNTSIKLHFKDNTEMNESLFNILPYGNAQYMSAGDSWSTSQRTDSLVKYNSIEELFLNNKLDQTAFKKYHSYSSK